MSGAQVPSSGPPYSSLITAPAASFCPLCSRPNACLVRRKPPGEARRVVVEDKDWVVPFVFFLFFCVFCVVFCVAFCVVFLCVLCFAFCRGAVIAPPWLMTAFAKQRDTHVYTQQQHTLTRTCPPSSMCVPPLSAPSRPLPRTHCAACAAGRSQKRQFHPRRQSNWLGLGSLRTLWCRGFCFESGLGGAWWWLGGGGGMQHKTTQCFLHKRPSHNQTPTHSPRTCRPCTLSCRTCRRAW